VWTFLTTQGFSSVGALALTTVLGKTVFDLTGREIDLGILGLVEFLPSLVLVLVTGTVADRFDRRRIASIGIFFEAVAAAALAWYVSTDPTSAAPIFFIVDTDQGAALYVGPAFSYFEVITTGSATEPPARLTDEEWRQRLENNEYPTAPAWTTSFRLPTAHPPQILALPERLDNPAPTTTQPGPFSPLATPTP